MPVKDKKLRVNAVTPISNEGQDAMQRRLRRQPTVQVKVRMQRTSPATGQGEGESKNLEKDVFKLLKEKKSLEKVRIKVQK